MVEDDIQYSDVMAIAFCKLTWFCAVACASSYFYTGEHSIDWIGALTLAGLFSSLFVSLSLLLRVTYPDRRVPSIRLPFPDIDFAIAGPNGTPARISPYYFELHWETDDPFDYPYL